MPQTPAQRRAAHAVGAWLAANEKNPTWLVGKTGADPGTIGDFLNEKRWPKSGTQGKIEAALGWPAGSIRQIGNGASPEDVGAHAAHAQADASGALAMSTDELMANLLRARAETDALRSEVRELAARVNKVEAQLYKGSEEQMLDYFEAGRRADRIEPTFQEVMEAHDRAAAAMGMTRDEWYEAGRPTQVEARRAARNIGRKSDGQQHRAHLDQVGEDSQDPGDTDPA